MRTVSPSLSETLRETRGVTEIPHSWPLNRFSRAAFILISIGILGMAVCLRTSHLLDVSFWFDEACSWRMSQFPLPELFDALARDAHPPLFHLLQKIWHLSCGTSIVAARSLSVVLGLGTVLAAGWFAAMMIRSDSMGTSVQRRTTTSFFPLFCSLIVAMNPLQIEFSQSARPYALGTLLALLAGGCLLRALESPSRIGNWLGLCLSSTALSFTHYYGLCTVLALLLAGGLEIVLASQNEAASQTNSQRFSGLLLCAGFWQLCWWPWQSTFAFQRARTTSQLWQSPLSLHDIQQVAWKTLAGSTSTDASSIWGWLAVLVWLVVPVVLFWKCGRVGRLIALCIAVPVTMSLGYSCFLRNVLEARYLVFSQIFLLLGICLILFRIPFRPLSVTGCVLLVICLANGCREYAGQRVWSANHSGIRRAMEFLDEERQADEPVLISTPFLFVSAMESLRTPHYVYVKYAGDHRQDLLAGPPLRACDYLPLPGILMADHPRLWTIDVEEFFGESESVDVPVSYRPTGQRRFAESFGIPMVLLVRSYELKVTSKSQFENWEGEAPAELIHRGLGPEDASQSPSQSANRTQRKVLSGNL